MYHLTTSIGPDSDKIRSMQLFPVWPVCTNERIEPVLIIRNQGPHFSQFDSKQTNFKEVNFPPKIDWNMVS